MRQHQEQAHAATTVASRGSNSNKYMQQAHAATTRNLSRSHSSNILQGLHSSINRSNRHMQQIKQACRNVNISNKWMQRAQQQAHAACISTSIAAILAANTATSTGNNCIEQMQQAQQQAHAGTTASISMKHNSSKAKGLHTSNLCSSRYRQPHTCNNSRSNINTK